MTDNIDDQYDEAMELFGGKPIPKIGNPTEYVGLTEEYQKALIEKYGHVPDLANMVAVDEDEDDDDCTNPYCPCHEDDD